MRTPLRILLAVVAGALLWQFVRLGWKVIVEGSPAMLP